jgi:hypothetical protein
MKSSSNTQRFAAAALWIGAGVLVWKGMNPSSANLKAGVADERNSFTGNSHRPRSAYAGMGSLEGRDATEILPVQPLAIPAGVLGEETQNPPTPRVIAEDDAILLAGGVISHAAPATHPDQQTTRTKRLESLASKDWDGQGNLLVNELRAGNGFSVEWQQVEDFLLGKDLLGWPEGQRNWIGDELMTMLRQEQPSQAYELLARIQADANAPEAMRDYSIQHISHLIGNGQAGQEGVEIIRQAYQSGDPVLASTALISLHRLSEKAPDLISPKSVKSYAEKSKQSTDFRLKQSALAILKEDEMSGGSRR